MGRAFVPGLVSVGVPGVLDADVGALLARAAELDLPALPGLGVAGARDEFLRRVLRSNPAAPAGVETRDLAAGGVRLRLYRPAPASSETPLSGVLLYFHGGGFVLGGLDSHDAICRVLAAESGGAVAAVDYRLAPEHPYPAAVEDALAALVWLDGGPAELGGRPAVIGVAGDSAGGTLAAVAAHHARDRGIPLARQILAYPAVDQGGDWPSARRLAEGHLLTAADVAWFGRLYFGDRPGPVTEPDAAPLRAPCHAGLAPALVVTAGFDPLADEGAAYAAALAAAGVPVRHLRLEGGVHGCLGLARLVACGRRALDEMAEAWRSALG